MDLQTLLIIIAVAVLAVIGTGVYILKAGAKPTQNAALLYQDWTERFGLEPLSEGKNAGEKNAKILQRNLKLLWNKRELEELDLKPEIEGLTQEDALSYTAQANGYFLEKTTKAFAYDIHDARDGNLRLFSLEKDSPEYRSFVFGQAVIKLLKERTSLAEFPDIEFPEGSTEESLGALHSFVIAQSSVSIDPDELYKVTAYLSEKFGDQWGVFLLSEDVVKFEKLEPEEESPEIEEEKDLSPFAQQREAKRLADEEAERERIAAEAERRLRWESAEKERKKKELEERQLAIDAGKISPLVTQPLAFLAQVIEVASDKSNLLSMDEEVEIQTHNRIGEPVLFTVYSSELLQAESPEVVKFQRIVIQALQQNFGDSWRAELEGDEASSISFIRGV